MICPKCREGKHAKCTNIKKAGVSSFIARHGNWCDCQHQPGTSLNPEATRTRDDSLGTVHGETSTATVHVPAS